MEFRSRCIICQIQEYRIWFEEFKRQAELANLSDQRTVTVFRNKMKAGHKALVEGIIQRHNGKITMQALDKEAGHVLTSGNANAFFCHWLQEMQQGKDEFVMPFLAQWKEVAVNVYKGTLDQPGAIMQLEKSLNPKC